MGFVKLYHVYTCRIYFIVISRNFIGSIKLAKLTPLSLFTVKNILTSFCICLASETCTLGYVRVVGIAVFPSGLDFLSLDLQWHKLFRM